MDYSIHKLRIIWEGFAMTQNNDDRTDSFSEGSEDKSYNEQYSLWKENMKAKLGTLPAKNSEKSTLSRFGIGFLILVILLILLFARNRSIVLGNRMTALENRLTTIEEKVAKLDMVDDQMAQSLDQAQMIQQFKDRFDRSEAALASRLDQMQINLGSLQKRMDTTTARKTSASKTAKPSKKTAINTYHIVKSGETLYQIGLLYGLTVKQLHQLNRLNNGDTIHPGQKLLISP